MGLFLGIVDFNQIWQCVRIVICKILYCDILNFLYVLHQNKHFSGKKSELISCEGVICNFITLLAWCQFCNKTLPTFKVCDNILTLAFILVITCFIISGVELIHPRKVTTFIICCITGGGISFTVIIPTRTVGTSIGIHLLIVELPSWTQY